MAANDSMPRTSLYVGDLHPEVTETDLVETFGRVGPVLSVRLCRDNQSAKSLCYAYVNFWFHCHASAALKSLNHTILKGKSMRVMWCQRDPITRKNSIGNLFVKNLHESITSSRLQEIFSKYGTILSCKVVEEKGISRGFGFVQFDSEDSAMAAVNALHDTVLEGKKLYVCKFRKKIERSFRSLFVKNLDETITEDILKDKFSEHGKVTSVVIIKDDKGKSKGFGFVNFDSHEAAKNAMEVMNRQLIAEVVRNGDGVSRGFGFVHFSCPEEAMNALYSLVGAEFEGKTLYLALARPKAQQTRKLEKSYAQIPVQPIYTSTRQPRQCNYPNFSYPIPTKYPSPWYPISHQNYVRPFSSYDPFQAQNLGVVYAFPMQSWDVYGQDRCVEIGKGQIQPNRSQNKITNGDVKELCKGPAGTMKTSLKRSCPQIYKIMPCHMRQPLVQNYQFWHPVYASSGNGVQLDTTKYEPQRLLSSTEILGGVH
ncbi:hypothetical protein DH2020_041115 [Rehmannia glutinosa]|uniref:RRM domain-containing protein n=1 Tax=Rehmannia glutinosa TaxID=99300 RepID=A0ABR0UR53_REHGL